LAISRCPPAEPDTTWQAHYRARLFDPAGLRPPIWFQEVPETKAGKNRLHLDLYPTARDDALPLELRIEIVEAKVAELVVLGASIERRTRHDDPVYYVIMHDPEGNEFCVSRAELACHPCCWCPKAVRWQLRLTALANRWRSRGPG